MRPITLLALFLILSIRFGAVVAAAEPAPNQSPKPSGVAVKPLSPETETKLEELLAITDPSDPDLELKHWLLRYVESSISNPDDAILKEIRTRIAEALFNTTKQEVFYRRLDLLQSTYRLLARENPAILAYFQTLDTHLQEYWLTLDKVVVKKRLYIAAAGAVVGLLAIPVEYGILSKLSITKKWLYLLVPATVLAGGGIGYLGGTLFATRRYNYDSLDLGLQQEALDARDIMKELEELKRRLK